MQLVRFVRQKSPYNIGETAGFPEDVASRLIADGVAVVASTPAVLDHQVVVKDVPQTVTARPAVRPPASKRR